ncbi:MAG: DUF1707 domain-containing protein [Pseudonocardia sp.]|nr:DUF1707 domain-containing protein [Pseudonocardia sp.]
MTNTQIPDLDTLVPTPDPFPPTVAPGGSALLASDTERELVTDRLRAAAAEGRLTLTESDGRQAAAYAARTRAELTPLGSDLPRPPGRSRPARRGPMTPRARRRFHVHVAIVAVLFTVFVTAWAVGAAPFFWPAWPTFWLLLSLFVHARRAEREPSPEELVPAELR